MSITLAILSDLHFGDPPPIPKRRGELADTLLLRAVHRFNRFIQPDVVLVLGDLLDHPQDAQAGERLMRLRQVLDKLACPYVVIPGNHDPQPQRFYEVFAKPADQVDIAGRVRILPFVDPEQPGYNAMRHADDLKRLEQARQDGFDGWVVAAQHVPVMPRGSELRYSYTNLDNVLDACEAGCVDLCVSGHVHEASDLVQHGRCGYFSVAAMCEQPFAYTLVTLTDGKPARVRQETLAMPAELQLVDYHSHSQFAYCAQTVNMTDSPVFAQAMGLRAMSFTEHSGHLYASKRDYGSARFCQVDLTQTPSADWRMDDYRQQVQQVRSPSVLTGLEVDADFQGRPVLRAEHRQGMDVIVGAVHFLPEGIKPPQQRDLGRFVEQFRQVTEGICRSDIHILAHPFRVFRRAGLTAPPSLYPWLADLLRDTGVASELNYHTNEPHAAFVQLCLDRQVKLSLGSDAHELWEVGEFYPHLRLLEQLGVSGRDLWLCLINLLDRIGSETS